MTERMSESTEKCVEDVVVFMTNGDIISTKTADKTKKHG